MSEGGFHVHGPHDHEVEHAVEHASHGGEGSKMINQIAMFTALIATVGAIFAYMGGATQANAGLYKNNAAIKKTEASNQWNYFQSKSTKQSLAEVSRDLSPEDKKATYIAKMERYEKEKNEIKAVAEGLEKDATEWDKQSDEQMHQHHRWAQATTALQVSIALAAIALLTKKKWLEYGMFVVAGIGGVVGVLAVLHIEQRAAMKITTWNVNSLTARLQHVLDWLAANPVDVLCLQELKLTDDKFPLEALSAAGYPHCAVFGQKTYNGVAIISRAPLRDVVRNIVGFEDEHSRVIAATVDGPGGELRVVNGYFVNGQEPGSEKFAYKMRWLDGLRNYMRAELAQRPRLVLLGDFNVAPEDRDSYDPVGLAETIHHTSAEREHFRQLLALGLVDSFRLFEQPPKSYSWWDYRMLGYQKNRGLRIDHILVSQPLRPQVAGCAVDRVPRKWEKPSDHAPVTLELVAPA